MPTLHHVNLSVPELVDDVPGTEAETAWLELLGYRPIEPGPEIASMTSVWWFEADDGTQVHLTPDAAHAPSPKAHTAIRLDDALDATVARIEAAGQACLTVTFDGDRHVFANDPAGNVWELIAALPT
jgi:catechol 2,3-dioxygenase-like lactoylglutathione lyase family enzyme